MQTTKGHACEAAPKKTALKKMVAPSRHGAQLRLGLLLLLLLLLLGTAVAAGAAMDRPIPVPTKQ